MDIPFLISFFARIYQGFTAPRFIKVNRNASNLVINYHKISSEEFKRIAPVTLFLVFGFLIVPLASAPCIRTDFLAEFKEAGDMLLGACAFMWLLGYFYLSYRVIMRWLCGTMTLTFSSADLTVDRAFLGIRTVDTLRIPRNLIRGADIVRGFGTMWRPVLTLEHTGRQLIIMRARSVEDMIRVKRLIDEYACARDPFRSWMETA